MIVPSNQSPTTRQARGVPAPITPPPDVFLAMAAAQMHTEGRLFEPKAPDLYETRPQASLGGRSLVEANQPQLGPSDVELRAREREMEATRRRNAK